MIHIMDIVKDIFHVLIDLCMAKSRNEAVAEQLRV